MINRKLQPVERKVISENGHLKLWDEKCPAPRDGLMRGSIPPRAEAYWKAQENRPKGA